MAARAEYLPLFAKAQVIVGILGSIVVMAVLYPERKIEADAYNRAPVCAAQATDVTNCRRMATAEVVRVECPRKYSTLEACDLYLRLDNRDTFINLKREVSESLKPGSPLRIELLGPAPTAAEIDGKMIPRYGSPAGAMSSMREAVALQAVLTTAAVIYLVRRRRRLASGAAAD